MCLPKRKGGDGRDKAKGRKKGGRVRRQVEKEIGKIGGQWWAVEVQ
jgi:hypothetical protein